MNLQGRWQQVHDLRDARPRDVAHTRDVCVVGGRAAPHEPVHPHRQFIRRARRGTRPGAICSRRQLSEPGIH